MRRLSTSSAHCVLHGGSWSRSPLTPRRPRRRSLPDPAAQRLPNPLPAPMVRVVADERARRPWARGRRGSSRRRRGLRRWTIAGCQQTRCRLPDDPAPPIRVTLIRKAPRRGGAVESRSLSQSTKRDCNCLFHRQAKRAMRLRARAVARAVRMMRISFDDCIYIMT